jgi:hypothetical protein
MLKILDIKTTAAPGDIRTLGRGDLICLSRASFELANWPAYWDAVGMAVVRGAELRIY